MSGEQQNIYDFITDPIDKTLYPVKSKKGARILKNYISIYRNGSDTTKTVIPNQEYTILNIKQRLGNFNTYGTQKNTLNMNGVDSNEAYSHVAEYSTNLGHWGNNSSTILKVLVLCATGTSFNNRKSLNWINLINPHISSEFITRNLPFEVTWFGGNIDNNVVYDTGGTKETPPCDMENMKIECIKHTLIKGNIPTYSENKKIREGGGIVSGKIDALGHNKYDIIIDEFCPKISDIGIVYESLIPHMRKESWIMSSHDLSNGEGTWAREKGIEGISTNLIKETKIFEIPSPKSPIELAQILKSTDLVKEELKRAGIYEFTQQKVFNNSKLDDINHLVHRLVNEQYPDDRNEDKLYKTEAVLFNLRKPPYNNIIKALYVHKLIPELFD